MKTALAVLAALLTVPAHAARVDDSDLGRPGVSAQSAAALASEGRAEGNIRVFRLSSAEGGHTAVPGMVSGRVELLDAAGAAHPARLGKIQVSGRSSWTSLDDAGHFSLPAVGYVKLRVSLDNARWHVLSDNDAAYVWESAPVASGSDVTLSPEAGSENAKLAVLHLTYLKAWDFLAKEGTTDWWKDSLTVVWPGGADYFEPGAWTLHITDPLAWDIITHELGHAVMYGSMDAHGDGGSHKIDECYSAGLAWSEGWASFFAAAVHLSPDDADAKFEFMVPRRKPIRIENVPADVCQGPNSEWRVFAGLWDLYDRHEDGGDRVSLGFGPIWKGTHAGSTSSFGDAWNLIAAQADPVARRAGEDALIFNTLLPARAETARLSAPPDFDGAAR